MFMNEVKSTSAINVEHCSVVKPWWLVAYTVALWNIREYKFGYLHRVYNLETKVK